MYQKIAVLGCIILSMTFFQTGIVTAVMQQPFLSITMMHPGKVLDNIEALSSEAKHPVPPDLVMQKISVFPQKIFDLLFLVE